MNPPLFIKSISGSINSTITGSTATGTDFERILSLADTPEGFFPREALTLAFSINYYKSYRSDRHFKGGRNEK